MRKLAHTIFAITLVCLTGHLSTADAVPCTIIPTANRDIIRGAQSQIITLNADQACFDAGKTTISMRLVRNDISIDGELKKGKESPGDATLTLRQIRGTLSLGEAEFEISTSDAVSLATKKITLHVTEISIANSTVTYSDIEKNITHSQQHRKMPPPPLGSGLPIAVANPIIASYKEKNGAEANLQVINHAYLNMPGSIDQTSTREWKIYAITPGVPNFQFVNSDRRLVNEITLPSPREISYVIDQQHDSRIRAKLELVPKISSDGPPLLSIEIELADSARPGIGQPIRISDLISVVCGKPGADQSDVATNGVTHAISRNLMSQGQCYIYIDPCNSHYGTPKGDREPQGSPIEQNLTRVARTLLTPNDKDDDATLTAEVRLMYNLYGAQNLLVTVERQGVSGKWEGRWTVEPSSWSCRSWGRSSPGAGPGLSQGQGPGVGPGLGQSNQSATTYSSLPRPSKNWTYQPAEALRLKPPTTDQGGGEEVYQIHVQAAARSPVVEYADGVVVPSGDGVQYLSPEYQFDARLRPSGLFGLPYRRGGSWDGRSARIFVTLPIEGVSLRFPTSLRDLHSTSDSTAVQVLTLRAGALLTIEPWDYNRGENFFAIPLRFQAGGHLIDLGSGAFTPSLLIGFSAALPLVQTSVKFAQTTVGLGAFYELDGRDGSSHALLTVGLNLLSLFSPPAGASN